MQILNSVSDREETRFGGSERVERLRMNQDLPRDLGPEFEVESKVEDLERREGVGRSQ